MVHNWVLYSGESQEKASEKTEQFLKMIVDPNKRIYFAEKFQNFEVAIDVSYRSFLTKKRTIFL